MVNDRHFLHDGPPAMSENRDESVQAVERRQQLEH